MEEKQEELIKRKQKLDSLKKFFESDMRIKEEILKLAPNKLDDANEESRMEYSDKLYDALKYFQMEFINMVNNILGGNPNIIEKITEHFARVKESLARGHYNPGVIGKMYQEQFTDMSPKLVEDVKQEFVGYTICRGNLTGMIKKSTTINELLHVLHSYVLNNEGLLQSLPIIETKRNSGNYPITLYGEETEISRKLFDGIPEDLDVGWTEIVSMPNKILMMVRDRGHALTIDMDTTKEDDIGVKYFVPKICNDTMVAALPGINPSSITDNGATGFFVTSKEAIASKLVDFIGRVPTDADIEPIDWEEMRRMVRESKTNNGAEQPNTNTQQKAEPIFGEEDALQLATDNSEKGTRIGIIQQLQSTFTQAKTKLKNVFRGEENDDRTNGD